MDLTLGAGIRISALAAALAAAATLAACGGMGNKVQAPQASTIVATIPEPPSPSGAIPATRQDIAVSKNVWANYQDYLAKVGQLGAGYFFVTEDGTGGGSWACGNALCEGNFDGMGAAKRECESANTGKTCLLFAKDNRTQVTYTVAP